jgi:hypothetical protein
MMVSGSRVNEELLWLYINRSGEAFDWLMAQGGEAVDATIYTGYIGGLVLRNTPARILFFKSPVFDKYRFSSGGQLVVEILERTILESGNSVLRPFRAEQLEKDAKGRVVSFLAKAGRTGILCALSAKRE